MGELKDPIIGVNQVELLRARVKSAQEAVDQARIELENAKTDDGKIVWENRLAQRQKELDGLQEELDFLEKEYRIAA